MLAGLAPQSFLTPKALCALCLTLPAAAVDAADSKLARSETQKAAVKASEAARLEAVLELAGKCNKALREEDWELM